MLTDDYPEFIVRFIVVPPVVLLNAVHFSWCRMKMKESGRTDSAVDFHPL